MTTRTFLPRRLFHFSSFKSFGLPCLLAALFLGCTTGERAYQKGRYQEAVLQAVKRLKSDPDNEKAISVLQRAYPDAERWHLENIDASLGSRSKLSWESVANSYQQLNQLANAIRTTPAARRIFSQPNPYIEELSDASEKSAEARYQLGVELLAAGDRISARQSIVHFQRANQWSPGYKDTQAQLEKASDLATLKVVINPTTGPDTGLDYQFFENQMHEFISNYRPHPFVRFFTAEEATNVGLKSPDHIINLKFAPFPIGESHTTEEHKTFRRENVLLGQTRSNPPQDVYGTVKANAIIWTITVAASAQLDLQIIDGSSGKSIRQRRLPGTASWDSSWATFQGDGRAIPEDIKPLLDARPQQPPPPQALFEYSAASLFEHAAKEIRTTYKQFN